MRATSNNLTNLIGKKFYRLTVIARSESLDARGKNHYWVCKCDCGTVKDIHHWRLTGDRIQSCGCIRRGKSFRTRKNYGINVLDRFGRLTVVGEGQVHNGLLHRPCLCTCGNLIAVREISLKTRHTSSCGCARREAELRLGESRSTHGQSGHPLYATWRHMVWRCQPSNRIDYHGRGISVCKEWSTIEGFAAFVAHVGPKPSKRHSLDRINNDGNYEPGNVKWSTAKEQRLNQRKRVRLEQFTDAELISEVHRRWGI